MEDEVYKKLQRIRDKYYFCHPLFKYLLNKDASLCLKSKIREKQIDVELNMLPQEQYNHFLNSEIETILYELLEETKIKDATDILATTINEDLNKAQHLMKGIELLLGAP